MRRARFCQQRGKGREKGPVLSTEGYALWEGPGFVNGLPVTRATSANQNDVTSDIPRKMPEEWLPRLTHKLKHSDKSKRPFKSELPRRSKYICTVKRSLMKGNISCSQIWLTVFILLNAGISLKLSSTQHSSTWWSGRMLVRTYLWGTPQKKTKKQQQTNKGSW